MIKELITKVEKAIEILKPVNKDNVDECVYLAVSKYRKEVEQCMDILVKIKNNKVQINEEVLSDRVNNALNPIFHFESYINDLVKVGV